MSDGVFTYKFSPEQFDEINRLIEEATADGGDKLEAVLCRLVAERDALREAVFRLPDVVPEDVRAGSIPTLKLIDRIMACQALLPEDYMP